MRPKCGAPFGQSRLRQTGWPRVLATVETLPPGGGDGVLRSSVQERSRQLRHYIVLGRTRRFGRSAPHPLVFDWQSTLGGRIPDPMRRRRAIASDGNVNQAGRTGRRKARPLHVVVGRGSGDGGGIDPARGRQSLRRLASDVAKSQCGFRGGGPDCPERSDRLAVRGKTRSPPSDETSIVARA